MKSTARRLAALTALAVLSTFTACGSVPRLHVTSQPETARIYVNGTLVGNTPADINLPFGEGERVFLQVVHPAGQLVGTQIFTQNNLPATGEVTFDLR